MLKRLDLHFVKIFCFAVCEVLLLTCYTPSKRTVFLFVWPFETYSLWNLKIVTLPLLILPVTQSYLSKIKNSVKFWLDPDKHLSVSSLWEQ